MFNFRRIRWALRKVSLPIKSSGLVLDVGSGGFPYPRADVLLDRLTGSEHRNGDSMMIDRPTVFGDAQKMPFKDKAFDFVIASHILEHMSSPENFLVEIQRVGKAGYIETPNIFFERFFPYNIHCLEVMYIGGALHIHKKHGPIEDSFLGSLNMLCNDPKWSKYFINNPDMFHVRYFWNDKINYKIDNPEISSDWIERINAESQVSEAKVSYAHREKGWRSSGLNMLNRWHSFLRVRRLKHFDLLSILVCPDCHGQLRQQDHWLTCEGCQISYQYNGIPDFTIKYPNHQKS